MGNQFAKLQKYDADDLFAYDTVKEVLVLDRRLGGVYYAVLLMVLFYVVIYVFMIKKQYLDTEKTTGWIVSKVTNPAFDKENNPWDMFDSVTNPGEQGAVFLPTRVLITRGQVQEGSCESPLLPCGADADCDLGEQFQEAKCSNGRCMRRQWCPAEEVGKEYTEEHLINAKSYDIWFSTSLHYHKFMLDVSTTDELKSVRFPAEHANTYPLHDLLRMADVKLEEVEHLGAIISVTQMIDCDLDAFQCKLHLETGNVDSTSGFNYVHNYFYFDDSGVRKKDTFHFYGIRLIATAVGVGRQTSASNIILQVSSAIALLACAQQVADVFLQYLVPERRHYVEHKVLPTEDFNEEE